MKETISVDKLNCTYCTKLIKGKCDIDVIRFDLGRKPEKEYCVQIFKFHEDRVNAKR